MDGYGCLAAAGSRSLSVLTLIYQLLYNLFAHVTWRDPAAFPLVISGVRHMMRSAAAADFNATEMTNMKLSPQLKCQDRASSSGSAAARSLVHLLPPTTTKKTPILSPTTHTHSHTQNTPLSQDLMPGKLTGSVNSTAAAV